MTLPDILKVFYIYVLYLFFCIKFIVSLFAWSNNAISHAPRIYLLQVEKHIQYYSIYKSVFKQDSFKVTHHKL